MYGPSAYVGGSGGVIKTEWLTLELHPSHERTRRAHARSPVAAPNASPAGATTIPKAHAQASSASELKRIRRQNSEHPIHASELDYSGHSWIVILV